jgi:molecular chaperone DnaK
MGWGLAIDLGTTFTAAAVWRDGRAEVVALGTQSLVIPSVVAARPDGGLVVGEAAERRAATEPGWVARECKRRLGDPVPMILGGTPYGTESLAAAILGAVLAQVATREGGPPDAVALTHPASWSDYRREQLRVAARQAGIAAPLLVPEPIAAAVHYAALGRVEIGAVVAVYDLGGGTFDTAVVRRDVDGYRLLGVPEGLDRFGGVDIDDAIVAHVDAALGGALRELAADPATAAGLARVRAESRAAKEALSSDLDVVVPVDVAGARHAVRLTRAEVEAMVRPRIADTVAALERTVRSAGLTVDDVARVLLVGGSSRIPVVAQAVAEATGRPVTADADPKGSVVLGAATILGQGRIAGPAAGGAVPPAGGGSPPPRAPLADPGGPRARRRPRRAAVAAVVGVVAVAVVVLGVAAMRGDDDPSTAGIATESSDTTTADAATTEPGVDATAPVTTASSGGASSTPGETSAVGPTPITTPSGDPPALHYLGVRVDLETWAFGDGVLVVHATATNTLAASTELGGESAWLTVAADGVTRAGILTGDREIAAGATVRWTMDFDGIDHAPRDATLRLGAANERAAALTFVGLGPTDLGTPRPVTPGQVIADTGLEITVVDAQLAPTYETTPGLAYQVFEDRLALSLDLSVHASAATTLTHDDLVLVGPDGTTIGLTSPYPLELPLAADATAAVHAVFVVPEPVAGVYRLRSTVGDGGATAEAELRL